jgi:hypothetical protein
VLERIAGLPDHILLDTTFLSAAAGSGRAANMVTLGAGGCILGLSVDELEPHVHTLFAGKSQRVVQANCRALRLGTLAARVYRQERESGKSYAEALRCVAEIPPAELVERAEAHIPATAASDPPAVSPGG